MGHNQTLQYLIDNEQDAQLLRDKQDEFARAIARGVTDYEQEVF